MSREKLAFSRIFELLQLWQHALMQYPADEDSLSIRLVDNYMFTLLDAPIATPYRVASAPNLRRTCNWFEAIVEPVKVTLRLTVKRHTISK